METHAKDLLKPISTFSMVIGCFAGIGGVLALFGIQGSGLVGTYTIISGVIVALFGSLLRYIAILNTNLKAKEHLISTSEIYNSCYITDVNKNNLPDKVTEIHIIGSGTETYFAFVQKMVNEGVIARGAIINIAFRVGTQTSRYNKLFDYESKWLSLSKMNELKLKFYPISDYLFMMRGMVFDSSIGCVGFYTRKQNETIGSGKPALFLNNNSKFGNYLINHFIEIFDLIDQLDSITEAIPKVK